MEDDYTRRSRELFKQLDENGDGVLDKAELQKMLTGALQPLLPLTFPRAMRQTPRTQRWGPDPGHPSGRPLRPCGPAVARAGLG